MEYFVTNREAFKKRDFQDKILNIENTPMCTNLCSACKRTTYLEHHGWDRPVAGQDLGPDQLRKLLKYFRRVNFCGQLSDPIFGKHFIELLEVCNETQTMCQVMTAASARPRKWWKKAFEANPNAKWIFGIDGPPHLSHLYRKNQKGEFLFEMMLMAKEMGMNVLWQMIVFRFNEDKLESCFELAKKHDIKVDVLISSRDIEKELVPLNPKYNGMVRG